MVRGYFGPFADATGFPFTKMLGKEYLESTGRTFLIKGKMVGGKFVAVTDNTCVGPCKTIPSFESSWKACAAKGKVTKAPTTKPAKVTKAPTAAVKKTTPPTPKPAAEYPAKQPNAVEVAFYKWVMEINHAITLDSKECAAELSKHYDATSGMLQLWAGGQPAMGALNATTAGPTICGALGAAKNPSLSPMKIEVCGTSVRGYFGPLSDATDFPFTKVMGKEYLESTGRAFLIDGKMVNGKFVAVTDHTCVGACKNIKSFEWKCDSNYVPGSEYPAKQPNAVEVAFYKWVMEINHALTLDSKECAAALSKHYDATSGTLQLWAGGKPALDPLNAASAGPTLCGALGAAKNPSLGPMKIEVCGTLVRGYFGPFTDATGFPFTEMLGKEYLESTGRTFLIKGKMVAGKFVAVTDNTCVGPCENVESFEWKCDSKYVP